MGNTYDIGYGTVKSLYYQVTVTNVAQSLTSLIGGNIPGTITMAYITPETGAIRYRCDGTAPTSAIGQPIALNQNWPVQGGINLQAMQLIAAANTTVSIELRG